MTSKNCLTGILLILGIHLKIVTSQTNSSVTNSSLDANATGDPFSSSTTPMPIVPGNFTSKISCRSFTCNSTTCYNLYNNMTPGACGPDVSFCELKKLDGVMYSVNCSNNCNATSDRCRTQPWSNCTVDCCNVTNCLNSSIFSLGVTTTPTPGTTITTTVSTTKATTIIPKKCNTLKCQGERCYMLEPKTTVNCLPSQDFCQLKKTVQLTVMTWEAGCSGNCSADKPCTSTATDCTQECCNATAAASCLKLDGTLNMPNSATLGPQSSVTFFSPWPVIWALGLCFLTG